MNSKLRIFLDRYWILLIIIAIKFWLQFALVNPIYELHRDEFLHLDQANHLAFGFISVPPLTSLLSKIIFLFGGDIFWVRLFPALFGALTIVFAWLIVESLGGGLFSKILASCALLFSVLVRLNILFQPNSFDILAWTIIFYLLIKFVQSDKPKWLFYLSVIVALGFYNKYNLVFLLIGLFGGILLSYQSRLLFIPAVWKAVLMAFLLILPNIIWQVAHHFPVAHHMQVLKENQLDNNSSLGFLKGQILFFFGSLPLSIAALIAFSFYRPFWIYRFIGISFVLVLALFSYLNAKDYYAIGLYPVLLAFGSVYIEKVLSLNWKRIVVPLLIGINLGVFILTAKLIYPVLTPSEINQNKEAFEKIGMLRWEDGQNHTLPQDFADMLGWREMAEKSLLAYKMIPASESEKTLVFCDNYGQTGALNYYNRKKMPEAYSFNTDYIYWLPRLNNIQNIVIVGDKPEQNIIDMFAECKLVGVVENEFAREKNTGIYLLRSGNPEFTDVFYKEAEDRKKNFHIF
jgi:4-amino-4-deoxy-L-arabinose transferase-like glycosyltransferase